MAQASPDRSDGIDIGSPGGATAGASAAAEVPSNRPSLACRPADGYAAVTQVDSAAILFRRRDLAGAPSVAAGTCPFRSTTITWKDVSSNADLLIALPGAPVR
jgi:hypothetical protein